MSDDIVSLLLIMGAFQAVSYLPSIKKLSREMLSAQSYSMLHLSCLSTLEDATSLSQVAPRLALFSFY